MKAIEVKQLTKFYRQHFWTPRRKVLKEVSFEVLPGEVFGFLGPNGSGKSTTIKILLEIIFPSSGGALVFDEPAGSREVKARIGFLPENPYFYDYLTAKEFLEFHGSLMGMAGRSLKSRIFEVLERVGMKGTENTRLRTFSKGMVQRVGLAQAILHDPDLIILDEPMTGLDPLGRKEVRDIMLDLKAQGKTVFFSTHILGDVEAICDRIAILNKGELLSCGPLETLISAESKYVDILWDNPIRDVKAWDLPKALELYDQVETTYMKLLRLEGEAQSDFDGRVNTLVKACLDRGGRVQSISRKKESLEDVFVRQIGILDSRI